MGDTEAIDADDESELSCNKEVVIVKKKRGRKPKNSNVVTETVVKEKKKRGRKPKVVDPDEIVEIPRMRKRGRRPKCPVKSISEIREKFKNIDDKVEFSKSSNIINDNHSQTHVPFGNLNIIVHKPPEIDTTELRKFYKNKEPSSSLQKPKNDTVELDYHSSFHSESESEVERKPIKYCSKCKCGNEETEIEGIELVKTERKKVNKQLVKFSTKLDDCGKWPTSSNSLCWWCCHSYTTVPIPSVIKYEEITKKYHLKGLFCSWECSYAFTSENCRNSSAIGKLYREWTGDRKMNVQRAPNKYVLKAFGGHMDISEFRKSPYVDRKIYLSEDHRMSYVNQDILEVYSEMEKKKKKKLKLSRKKPLKHTETLFENMSLG